jgi:CheY-like chemotaxis protein/predicted HicB family RNase H-like nuclease
MLFKKTQNIKPVPSAPPPAVESTRQEIAAHLRMADKHIREGNLADSKIELDAVRAIEPNNVYALALEERRQALEKAKAEPEIAAETSAAEVAEGKISEKPAVDEEAIRAEIEQRLETEYNKKFTEEIRKAEQRIAEALKKEREWQEAERASLIANLEKEKEKFRKDLEKQSKNMFEIEVAKMEASYRQQLSAERKKAEEETRAEMSALYEKSMADLKEAAVREKRQLLEKERKAIEESKTQMEGEFQKRLSGELAKGTGLSAADQEKEKAKFEEETRKRLQKEFEEKLEADRKRIEEQIRGQQKELEKSYEQRHEKLEQGTQSELNKRLEEIRQNEQKEFERKNSEIRAQLESEYNGKLAAELAKERERVEKQVEKELKERQSKLESERKKVVEEEQSKLDDARAVMRVEMEKEVEQKVADVKKSVEAIYREKLKLLGVKFPDTREEKLRIYVTRLREAWASPPVTAEAAREFMQLRDILGLSFEDHIELEGEVRLQVYVTEVEKEIKRGHVRSNDESFLEELKRRYQITPEEQKKLEPHILAAYQRAVMKAVILVVDDEAGFLETVRAVLEGYGYSVLTKQSPTDALKLLETTNVDMIIADVMFSGTEGDGFSFYERCQKVPHLKKVPFVLMSGMHESFFVRTGIQLGVDDYLTKPVDPDMLAAVVEGKLKKYKSLREAD